MLTITDISVAFGGVHALAGVSFEVGDGEVCALIGPNGAGKTTLLNIVTGLYRADSGSVRYDGAELLEVPRRELIRHGIGRTFQNVALFDGMTVLENVAVGAHTVSRNGWWLSALHVGPFGRHERAARRRAMQMLDLVGIAETAGLRPTGLPYGTMKKVELARALASDPTLLLLDEPAAGLTHHEVHELGELLSTLARDLSLSLVLVEHHMGLVMGISDHVVALNFGEVMADGTARAVAEDPQVVAAYLGVAS